MSCVCVRRGLGPCGDHSSGIAPPTGAGLSQRGYSPRSPHSLHDSCLSFPLHLFVLEDENVFLREERDGIGNPGRNMRDLGRKSLFDPWTHSFGAFCLDVRTLTFCQLMGFPYETTQS